MSEKLVIIFFWLAFMTYAAAFIFYLYLFINKRQIMGKLAISLTVLGLLFQIVSFGARWNSVGYIPVTGAFESYALFAMALVVTFLIIETLTKIEFLGAWVLPVVATLLGIAWLKYESVARTTDVVKNTWTVMHVTVVFLASASLIIATIFAVFYLIQQRQIKKRHVNLLFRRLPSLEVLDDLSSKAITFALPFMTMMIVTGVIRAIKKFPAWYLDPIVILATITWTIYGSYLVLRYLSAWQGRRLAYIAIGGAGSLFLMFFVQITKSLTMFHQFR